MLRTTKEPGSYRARVAGARRWWLLPAIGAPATGALACWWVGVVRHATLVRISGSTHAAAYALTVGVIGFTVVAGGVLSLAAAYLAGRPARREAIAAAEQAAVLAQGVTGPGKLQFSREAAEAVRDLRLRRDGRHLMLPGGVPAVPGPDDEEVTG
jgi:hypothetical protein